MKNRALPLILALILCFGIFAGCQSSGLKAYSDSEEESPSPEPTEETVKNYDDVFATYAPETVMFTVNGLDVTWQELFYWYHYDVSTMESYYGEITDWDAPTTFDATVTNSDFIKNDALEITKYYRALESKAKDVGAVLSAEDLATLDANWESNVSTYGGTEEIFINDYLNKAYTNKELFYYFSKIQALYNVLLEELYGANGEKLSEEDVLAKAEEHEYVRAKHILYKTVDDSNQPLSDEEIAAAHAKAETTLAELQAITDPAALEARMDELIATESEDTGSIYYKDGYTFGKGEMAAAFEDAVYGMEENTLSGIVETNYGYHIIMRLPLKADAVMEYYSETETHSLAYVMAQEVFSAALDSWVEEAQVSYSNEYESMDLPAMFAKAKTVPANS